MHPYRGILRLYRRPDCLYTIPDGPNTLTCQSTATNYAPRDPPSWPHYTHVILSGALNRLEKLTLRTPKSHPQRIYSAYTNHVNYLRETVLSSSNFPKMRHL